jgi:putative inorganic carbon (hco3(-)) transporter
VLAGGLALRAERWLSRGGYLAAMAICAAGIGVSFTRSSLVGVGVGLTLTALLSRRHWLVAAALLLGGASLVWVPGLRERLSSVDSNRPALYVAGARIIEDHPLLGVGDGNYQRVLHSTERYQMTPEGVAVATPHNSVLLATAHAGPLAGMLLFIVVLVVIGRLFLLSFWIQDRAAQTLVAALTGAVVSSWLQDQVNSLLFVPKTATWFCVFAALALVLGRGVTPGLPIAAGSPRPPPPSSR